MELKFNQEFKSRKDISSILGGDTIKGITSSRKINAILLFTNEDEIYADYFYPSGTYTHCLYTGIGRNGHQDSVSNNMYDLNMDVLTHKSNHKKLLLFEKRKSSYFFIGEYILTETHQNTQPDENNKLRRVFVFHLKKLRDKFIFS
ncbi:MAG: hypothetical protein ACLVKR_04370 [Lachnospiraceae bacterium]